MCPTWSVSNRSGSGSAVWVWNQMIKRTRLAFPFPSSTPHIPIFLSKADVSFVFLTCPKALASLMLRRDSPEVQV